MIRIHIFRCGATVVDEALPLANKSKNEAEWNACQKPQFRYLKRLWKGIDIKTFPNHEVDLFGDGSMLLLPMPGHSEGMTAV